MESAPLHVRTSHKAQAAAYLPLNGIHDTEERREGRVLGVQRARKHAEAGRKVSHVSVVPGRCSVELSQQLILAVVQCKLAAQHSRASCEQQLGGCAGGDSGFGLTARSAAWHVVRGSRVRNFSAADRVVASHDRAQRRSGSSRRGSGDGLCCFIACMSIAFRTA